MPTLHSRYRMRNADDRPHGLTWADIETLHRPARTPRTPVALALATSFLAGAAVGMLLGVIVVAVT
jgi:hypothetical protein